MTTPTKQRIPTLYSGAYGYRDCDPLGHIVATTIDGFNRAMREALDNETADSQSQCDHDVPDGQLCAEDCEDCEGTECPCCYPDYWYVGPFAESALAYLRECNETQFHRADVIDGLRMNGVAHS